MNDCAARCFSIKDDKLVFTDNQCLLCFHCFAICPTKSITINEIKPEEAEQFYQQYCLDNPTLKAIVQRKSIRHFKKEPIPESQLNMLLQSAKMAPSSRNTRGVSFVVLSREKLDQIAMLAAQTLHFEKAQEKFDLIFRGAPQLILAVADTTKPFNKVDGTIYLEYIDIIAQTMNIGTFWCGFLYSAMNLNPEIQKVLNLDQKYQVLGCLGIGYQDIHYKRIILREKFEQ